MSCCDFTSHPHDGTSLPWGTMAFASAGFLVGGAIGARLAIRTRGPRLARAFALFQIAVALLLLWRVARA